MQRWIKRLSLAQQFLVVNLVVLVLGMAVIGWWIGQQIKIGVINNTAATTALYVDSFIAPLIQDLGYGDSLPPERVATLDQLLHDTPLGQEIVAFKIWDHEGRIIYASEPAYIGRVFPTHGHLGEAWQGKVVAEISDLNAEENAVERQRWAQLIETYSPVRQAGTNQIIAVAEFYQSVNDLQGEIFAAQLRSWLLVGAAMLVMYLLLASVVKPASDIIMRQEVELRDKLAQLTGLLAQNKELNERVRRAATRTTALNERFLRRISAELHDGPGQDLALALLRIESLAENYVRHLALDSTVADDFNTVQVALESALADLRAISAGLRLPKIEPLSPAETIQRAIRDYERKTHQQVALTLGTLPPEAPLPVKITLYRVLQEALANGYRHASGKSQAVHAEITTGELCLEVADGGNGFDPETAQTNGHFGLAGMRERVEVLGGRFEINSLAGQGTTIRAYLPLTIPEVTAT